MMGSSTLRDKLPLVSSAGACPIRMSASTAVMFESSRAMKSFERLFVE